MKIFKLLVFPARIAAIGFLGILGLFSTSTAAQLSGTVELGGARTKVTLLEATSQRPRVIDQTRTNRDGEFELHSPSDETESVFFVTADVGWGVKLVTILGPELPAETTINELTTVAASYSMAQFYRKGYISGDAFGLRVAAGMNDNIVTTATGDSSPVLLASPNADQTNSLRMTRSLSNLLGATAENPLLRFLFFYFTRPAGGAMPHNTAVAMANLARDPGHNAAWIYLLSQFQETYSPPLSARPDGWTVTIKVNDSGDDNFLFGGPANVAFDSRGYAWVANNTVQGTPNSTNRIMVLKPNGKPADGGLGLPTSPITGGGILGVGWGITVDQNDKVWTGNFGWGSDDNWPTMTPPGNGSVSKIDSDGMPISVPEGYFGGTFRVQGIKSDQKGNMWMSSFGNDSVVVFPGGDPLQAQQFNLYAGAGPFGMAIDPDGAAWVTNSGGLAGQNESSLAKFVLNDDGEIKLEFIKRNLGHTLKVVDIDSQGNAWFASQGNTKVYGYRPDGRRIGAFDGGGMNGPWGLTIDGEDNIWVANFGPTELGVLRRGGLTKLAGANRATRPRGKRVGQALSPRTGYTVPSEGEQVLLHDGTPLNGEGSRPVYIPLMRQTGVSIDQAGNIWSVNNWKPRFLTDVVGFDQGEIQITDGPLDNANPGGDGLIIFVGLAPPRPRGE